MASVNPEKIRNVGVLGHAGVGKTILIEHILHAAGVTNRIGTIEDGNTVGDYLAEEIQHKHTIFMKLMHTDWDGTRVHLIDHPGYADFTGEVASSTPLLDGMIIVVDASTGPQFGTDTAMKYADQNKVPRAIFISKLDREHSDYYQAVEAIQKAYGDQCVPVVVPVGSGENLRGVINILTGESDESAERITAIKTQITDAVAESDDALLEKYLETGELSREDIDRGLHDGIKSGKIIPILAGAASKDIGIKELMDLIVHSFPSPVERKVVAENEKGEKIQLKVGPDEPFVGQVFRSVVDPYVGQLTYFRVLTGTLRSDSEFYNATTRSKERTGKIHLLNGKEQTVIDAVGPGDIAAMTKLKHTHFGDTLMASNGDLSLPKPQMPASVVKLAIEPKSRADEDKIGEALNRLAEEDPTFSHYRDPATNEHVVVGVGDLQLEIMMERLHHKFHVEAETRTPRVAYKETIRGKANVQGKHKKQSGGHGQYGDVHLKLSPGARGSGYEFVDSIVGGVVPRQYIPAVDKGAQEAIERGVIAGYPVTDIVVELHYGSYHDVDSSEMAFKIAAALAIQKGVLEANPCLLEPHVEIEITVPDEYMGDVNGDLNSRRGRILGMEPAGPGRQTIRANVPEGEVLRYSKDLRSMTGGRGSYTMKFSHYDEVPEHAAQPIIEEFEKRKAEGH